jgi:hypothetical protein
VLRGYRAQQPLNVAMGIGHARRNCRATGADEQRVCGGKAARGFYARWVSMLAADDWAEANRLSGA